MAMNWWTKLGCKLTGWDYNTLAQCSEASRAQLTKYTSALFILMLIWSVTGFCFAQRYIGLPWWACGFVSLFFVTIVVMVERQIILATERHIGILLFRGAIAIVMAVIGSTIIDQTMFGKDIDKQLTHTIEVQAAQLTQERVGQIDAKLATLQKDIKDKETENAALQADINARPFVVQKSMTTTTTPVTTSDGKVKTVSTPSVTTNQVVNPKQATLAENMKAVEKLKKQEDVWAQKKLTVEEDARRECQVNVGFLEELEAMWTIVTNRPIAGAFYLIFFALLVSLELFVAASKFFDKECDYESTIKWSQQARLMRLEAISRQKVAP